MTRAPSIEPIIPTSTIEENYKAGFADLFDKVMRFPGYGDRYLVYSEMESLMLVVDLDPKESRGIMTVVRVKEDRLVSFPAWKIPPLVVGTLRRYITGLMGDVKKRINGKL